VLGLPGTATSVPGNEATIHCDRRRLAICGDGPVDRQALGSTEYWITVGLIALYGMIIWLRFILVHRRAIIRG
jgi:hypothetical protein